MVSSIVRYLLSLTAFVAFVSLEVDYVPNLVQSSFLQIVVMVLLAGVALAVFAYLNGIYQKRDQQTTN